MADYQQYLPRLHEAHLTAMLGRHPAVVLHGARQTGKTTLCRAAAFSLGRRYLTLDDLQQRALARDDPGALFLGSDRVTVDEVQHAPELLSAVKQRIDDGRTPGRSCSPARRISCSCGRSPNRWRNGPSSSSCPDCSGRRSRAPDSAGC